MNQDLEIGYPQEVACTLHQESERYSCIVPLVNPFSHTLYLHVTSTFGPYLKQEGYVDQMAANSSVQLKFTFKSTNIISHTNQCLIISVSEERVGTVVPIRGCRMFRIQLKFSENFIDDVQIENIVEEQVNFILSQADAAFSKGDYKQGKNRYEEAFVYYSLQKQLLRRIHRSLYGLAQCSFRLRQWQLARKSIDSALVFSPNNSRYLLMRAKLLFEGFKQVKDGGDSLIQECFQILKEIQLDFAENLGTVQKQEMKQMIKFIEDSPSFNRLRVLKQRILKRALQRYQPQLQIGTFYTSRTQLSNQLRNILLSDTVQQNTTPEFVIDPISYQIMNAPFILPSGNSFQTKTLQEYFKTNGFKDPITRKETYPQWVFANHNLGQFIRTSPKLNIWRQYEYDIVHK